jgi:hypothetical protein
MSPSISRRDFVKESVLLSTGAALGLAGAAAGAAGDAGGAAPAAAKNALPMGKIGDVPVSRLILGGNIMTAYSHSRDLGYVSQLMRRYHTPEKILETLRIAEAQGINALVIPVRHLDDVLQRYRSEGGKMLFIRFCCPNPADPEHELDGFRQGIEEKGSDIMYIHGDPGYELIKQGKVDSFRRAVDYVKDHGIPVGVSAHYLEVIQACEQAKLDVDFYLKTFHTNRYASAPRDGDPGCSTSDRNDGGYDNSWCRNAQEVADGMKSIGKPWIAFKVMAAGAIPPRDGFQHAFSNGADFVLAGMFDWQIEEDAQIAREVISSVQRTYPWRA